jgi:hypothetical protein
MTDGAALTTDALRSLAATMTSRKSIKQTWGTTGAGVVIPSGMVTDLKESSSVTYLQIKDKALALRALYAENSVALPPTCDLATLIASAIKLSDAWLTGTAERIPIGLLHRVAQLDDIANAVLPLRSVPDRVQFLRHLTSGTLDILKRQKSKAKDTLWELGLWATLNRRSLPAVLEEPPDIVVNFEGARIGIACKTMYSSRHVQHVLSTGVSQIEATFDFGVIAINIDNLCPPNGILRSQTEESMSRSLSEFNRGFLHAHERHFRKYLASGRLLTALVSTGVLAHVAQPKLALNVARQATVWSIPGLPRAKDLAMRRFYDRLMS